MSTAELLHPPRRRPRPPGRPASSELAERSVQQRWERPALLALLALTAFAYIWDLSGSGYANTFYAAAVQAGTKSWKALFFGSIDSSNFITVDKPPASLWAMALSGRIFGFSSWSMLVPQALEGVAAVALLHATVKRWFGAGAGLLAGAVFALTPVAALMFRFNNPDALLTLTLVAAAYFLVRALEAGATRWMLLTGAMIGFGFLAKMGQALIVLPPFAAVYMLAAPVSPRRRLGQLLAGGGALVASAGWWVAIVALWPASSRPYIDGSPDNSILNLITGYNGLGRLTGSGGGAGNGGNFSGPAGLLRLFNSLMGGQASWLLPVALIALLAGLVATSRAARTDRTRAALLLWGGWLIVTAAVFSFSKGVIHTYYTVALAPAIAALVAIGAVLAWRRRERPLVRALAATALAGTALWAHVLLGRTPSFEPWLRTAVLPVGLLAAAALLAGPRLARGAASAAVLLAAFAALAGPTAYAIETITATHSGSVVSAGPATAGGGFGGGPGGGSFGGAPPAGLGARAGAGGGAAGGVGGEGANIGAALTKALRSGASGYRWAAATSGSQSAAGLELASGEPVMAIGGFNGEGGNLSLARFEAYVKAGEIHYFVAGGVGGGPSGGGPSGGGPARGGPGSARGGGPGGGPGGGSSAQIAEWVEKHYTATTIGGETVYDLAG